MRDGRAAFDGAQKRQAVGQIGVNDFDAIFEVERRRGAARSRTRT